MQPHHLLFFLTKKLFDEYFRPFFEKVDNTTRAKVVAGCLRMSLLWLAVVNFGCRFSLLTCFVRPAFQTSQILFETIQTCVVVPLR